MSRRQGGADAQKHGEAWESHVRYALDALRAQGRIACWWRQEPPVRVVRAPSGTTIVRTGKGPPDYVVAAHGCTWAVEAKQVAGGLLPWGRIEAHQAAALSAWDGQSARRSAVLARYVVDGRAVDVLVPWSAVVEGWRAWADSTGRAAPGEGSLSLDDALKVGRTDWGAALAGGGG